jgi:amino acid adenylation domain-containing protein
VALDEPGGRQVTYRQLADLSNRVRDRLRHLGVERGDRVGVCIAKSIDSVAAIFGVLKAGAAYVPVDPDGPMTRAGYILADCSVKVVLIQARLVDALAKAWPGANSALPPLLVLPTDAADLCLAAMLDRADGDDPAPAVPTDDPEPADLAYILYTSGSTGRPKGVMLSHRAATSFVGWCSGTFQPTEQDVFSSHAPFHFDLSILDLYLSLKHGARLVLIDDSLGKDPLKLAPLIAEKRISVWYSVPSILGFLAHYGKLDRHDFGGLRLVLFAGEVFPVPQLRALIAAWPHPRYFNLYGPTETNVCTFFEVPAAIPVDRIEPFPIGHACSHLSCKVVDPDGHEVMPGQEGELVVAGSGVMTGYWNLDEMSRSAFLVDAAGTRWYRTGDLVADTPPDGYLFHGRRDRMVKRRGYRIELGEIEAGLATHPGVREVAVVADPHPEEGVRIKAFLSLHQGTRFSPIQFKQFSVDRMPRYMVPDVFTVLEALPRTTTEKIDYQSLKAQS